MTGVPNDQLLGFSVQSTWSSTQKVMAITVHSKDYCNDFQQPQRVLQKISGMNIYICKFEEKLIPGVIIWMNVLNQLKKQPIFKMCIMKYKILFLFAGIFF